MYAIDFNTCTARDVIERSITCHPSLFAQAMRNAAKVHRDYSKVTTNKKVQAIAAHCGDVCDLVAIYTEGGDTELIYSHTRFLVQAFTVAAKLNLVPHSLQGDIIAREVAQ